MAQSRFRSICANYEIVTPLVLGGANHAPEFRLQSYANMVRWWWRFLALGRYGGEESVAAFWEAVLFGWSAKPFGRKRVNFRLDFVEPGFRWNGPRVPEGMSSWSGITYLTAQGFKDNELGRRESVDIRAFGVTARVQDEFVAATDGKLFDEFCQRTDQQSLARNFVSQRITEAGTEYGIAQTTLLDAMALIGLAGGIGARSRRGFGSLAVRELNWRKSDEALEHGEIFGLPESAEGYALLLKRYLGTGRYTCTGNPAIPPPYTVWSTLSRFEICATGEDSAKLMNEIGWAFQIYRSWGQKDGGGHVHRFAQADFLPPSLSGGAAKSGWYNQQFADDHEYFYANKLGGPMVDGTYFDNRSIFGLPHNYGTTQVGWSQDNSDGSFRRRASPLMFHFHRLADGRAVFMCVTAPAKFLPDIATAAGSATARSNLHVSKAANHRSIPAITDWSLLDGFNAFVRAPPTGANGGVSRGVVHTGYRPETISI